MIAPSLLLILNVLLSQFSQAAIKQDYETIRNHSATIAQILLIQDREKIYLKDYGQFLVALRWCESKFSDSAINPKDVDGPRSYIRYQFKPRTFLNFGIEYGLLPKNTTIKQIMELLKDGDLQEQIVVGMIENKVNLFQQFPDCYKRYGFLLKTQQ